MIVGLRDGESSPLEAIGIAEVALAPLSDGDARDIVARVAPVLASPVRDRIIRDAAGNPLALAELSAALGDDVAAGAELPEVLPLTVRLERTFATRADELPAKTRWLVLVAALDDRDGVAEVLAAAQVAAFSLRPAVDARLLEIDGASFRFRHPLIRSAIVQRATAPERQRAHAALASVVGDADRMAWHRAAATDLPDESVARLLDAAADRAIGRGAFAVALDALQRAATLSEDGRTRGTRLLRAADAANDIGHMDVVGEMLAASGPIDEPVLEDRRQAWLAALALTGPRSPRERERIERVVATALRAGDDGQRDLGLTLLQFAAARAWWLDPGVETRTRIAAAARQLAPDGNDACAIYLRAIAPEADLDELLMHLSERAAAAEPASGVDGRHLATAALWVGSLDLAVELFESSISALRSEGRLGLLSRSLIVRAFSSVHLGSLGTVASDLDEGMRLAMETSQPLFVATAMITEAIYLAYRGDIAGAEARIREVERLGVGQADGVLAETRHARGIVDLAAGRADDAYEQLHHLFDPDHPSYHPTVSGWAISDFGSAAAQTGRLDEASRVLDRVEADVARMKMRWLRIGSSYARAAIAAERPDTADAERAFATARSNDLERWPLARARLELCYGIWLRRQRRMPESRAELRSARDQLDAIGIPVSRGPSPGRARGERCPPSSPWAGCARSAHAAGAPDRTPGRGRAVQPRDRRSPVPQPSDGRFTSLPGLSQARRDLARSAPPRARKRDPGTLVEPSPPTDDDLRHLHVANPQRTSHRTVATSCPTGRA